jgi:hypothetical protein
MEDFAKYIPIIIAAGVFLDTITGYLPDKWVPYIGFIRRIVRAFLGIKK